VWSTNSHRFAYLDHGRVVVRDLHGSRRHRSDGDPAIHDFARSADELASPTGELVARSGPDYTIVVSRPDGSDRRVIKDDLGGYPSYGIGGWSPDGRKLLLMKDVGGGFSMRAVSVDPPFASETVVAYARVNNARSWPGSGDVSWQPVPDRLAAVTSPAVSAQLLTAGSMAAGWPHCPAIYTGHVRQKLSGNVCGPKRVIPGVNYSFKRHPPHQLHAPVQATRRPQGLELQGRRSARATSSSSSLSSAA
jgi:hypothetical protein